MERHEVYYTVQVLAQHGPVDTPHKWATDEQVHGKHLTYQAAKDRADAMPRDQWRTDARVVMVTVVRTEVVVTEDQG